MVGVAIHIVISVSV